jgi:hypothetical protein
MGNYHPILLTFGTQTKTYTLNLTITKAEEYSKKSPTMKCKKRYRFEKATLYEHEVIKKQKLLIRW